MLGSTYLSYKIVEGLTAKTSLWYYFRTTVKELDMMVHSIMHKQVELLMSYKTGFEQD